jgi:hypothetical protein
MRIVTTSATSLRLGGGAEASDAARVPEIVDPNRVEALVFLKEKRAHGYVPFLRHFVVTNKRWPQSRLCGS